MNKSSRILSTSCITIAIVLVTGCSSIVQKPQVNAVHKAAIVSLYANEKVPNADGLGVVNDWDDHVRMEVAEDALVTFANELQVTGWKLVNPDSVIQSKEYQDAFAVSDKVADSKMGKFVSLMQNVYRRQFFTPAGMWPIQLDDKEANTRYFGDAAKSNPKQRLADMAKKLGVDAVIIVQLDYCYDGGMLSMLGTGQAVMTAASSIKAVDRNGDVVINMPNPTMCGGDRGKSDTSAVMVKGNLEFTHVAKDRFKKMFIEATRASARVTVAEIQKAMN
ncbi:MAG: hypothetical protein P8079_10965 [Gammaproteobacteria bacterium]|jgi:hypothetical protein